MELHRSTTTSARKLWHTKACWDAGAIATAAVTNYICTCARHPTLDITSGETQLAAQAVVSLDFRSGATQMAAQAVVTLRSGAAQLAAQAAVTLDIRSGATQLAAQAVVTLDLRSGATQLAAQAVDQLDSGLASPSCLLKLLSH